MKKALIFLILSFLYNNITAQTILKNYIYPTTLQSSIEPSAVKFGFKAGFIVSNMNFNKGMPAPPTSIPASWKPGFMMGLYMKVPISNNLSIQPEYLYQQLSGKNINLGTEYFLSYLSLPVLVRYQFLPKLAVLAGPQFDLLIKSTEVAGGVRSNITHDTEERSVAANAGIEFSVFEKLSVSARYSHGFNHIGIGQRSNVTEFKFEMVQLSAVINF
jgi:opacity protein-like surface antigen